MCGAGDHQSTRSTWKSVRRRSEERAEAQRRRNSLGKMDSLDDAGEKKLQEQSQLQARKEHSQQQAEPHVSARDQCQRPLALE